MKKILFLHGALGAKDQFTALKRILADSYEIHSINFTGHGGNKIPGTAFSIEMFSEDIIQYINANSPGGMDIFGYSMGGYAVLYTAVRKPASIGRIFTLATKFDWRPETASHEAKMLDADTIKQKVPAFAEELSARHGAENWKAVLAKTAQMMLTLGNDNLLTAELLGKIENEVQVGVGDRDKMVTLEETVSAYRALPNSRLLVLPAAPHPIDKINISVLSGEIKNFFG
jgi:pimeloyl-ACP methyl ester carboxylesterase